MGVVCEMTSITNSLLGSPLRMRKLVVAFIDEIIKERWCGVVDVWWEVREGSNGCDRDIGGEESNGSGKWWSGQGGAVEVSSWTSLDKVAM